MPRAISYFFISHFPPLCPPCAPLRCAPLRTHLPALCATVRKLLRFRSVFVRGLRGCLRGCAQVVCSVCSVVYCCCCAVLRGLRSWCLLGRYACPYSVRFGWSWCLFPPWWPCTVAWVLAVFGLWWCAFCRWLAYLFE